MGNRAVITDRDMRIGVYLHWNGGMHSVSAFLKYCKMRGFRADSYGWARLCQVIGNFFGESLSVGIGVISDLDCDNGDNGMYIIKNWEIVGHRYDEPCVENYDVDEMLREIDEAQPLRDRLWRYLDTIEVPVSSLNVGDVVWMGKGESGLVPYVVEGFGDGIVNGCDMTGVPYTSECGKNNPNSYVRGETCMACFADDDADLIDASREYKRRHAEWMREPRKHDRPNFNEVLREMNERSR